MELAQRGGADLNMCLSVINSELERARGQLFQVETHDGALSEPPTTTAPAVTHLEARFNNLQQARDTIIALKKY